MQNKKEKSKELFKVNLNFLSSIKNVYKKITVFVVIECKPYYLRQ